MRHVLALDSAERPADVLLVNRLFGKLAAKEFKARGAFAQYQHQKRLLLDYVSTALANSPELQDVSLRTCQSGLGSANPSSAKSQCVGKPAPESHGRSDTLGQWSADRLRPADGCGRAETGEERRTSILLFEKLGVEQKYVWHYQWLGLHFGEGSEQQESFGRLIREVYSGNEENRAKARGRKDLD